MHVFTRRNPLRVALSVLALVLAAALPASAQSTGTIRGSVVATAGMRPLAGAQVSIPGTGLGTLTNAAGQFLLVNAPAGTHTVRVQMLGFGTAEAPVTVSAGQTASVSLELSETAIALDELVVTGTAAAVRAKEVGNSLDAITAAEISRVPVTNSQDALAGRSPGVTIMQNSGQPGAGGSIKIRGINTASQESEPLIYVDGIRIYNETQRNGWGGRTASSPLQDIPAEDIERIEVIKGAAATTLYGTEASGGVVQIFTKKGIASEPVWNAEVTAGVSKMGHWGDPDDPSSLYVQCGDTENLYGIATSNNPSTGVKRGQRQYMVDPTCPSDGDWQELGPQQSYSLSVRGGVNNVTYFLSGNYGNADGVLPTQNSKDGGFRGNFSFSPLENLNFQLSSAYQRRNTRWAGDGNNAEGFLLNVGRGHANYLKGGKGDDCANVPADKVCVSNGYVFEQDLYTRNDHFILGFTTNYTPVESLTNRFAVGWDYLDKNDETTLPFGFLTLPEGYYWDENTRHTKLSLDYAGSFQNNFGEQIASTFSWGGQLFRDTHRWTEIDVQTFAGPGEPTLESGAQLTYRGDSPFAETTGGLFLQEMVGFQDRLFLTGGMRVDGSSAFGDDFGFQMYPKLSLSYVLSDYAFWPTRWFDTFKLRAAVGESGKAPGAFDKLRTWQAIVGDDDQPGFSPNDIGNSEVGPERTRELEFGFDASLLAGRVGLEATYYSATTTDALVPVTYPPSEGFLLTRTENIGELANEGLELSANLGVLRTDAFDWRVRANASFMDSEVIDLDGNPLCSESPGDPNCTELPADVYTGLNSYVREGYAFPAYFGKKITNPDELAAPIVETDQFIGNVYPNRLYGFGTTLTLFNNLTLDALAEYQGGFVVQNYTGYQNARRGAWHPCFDFQEALLNGGDISQYTALTRAQCAIGTGFDVNFWTTPGDFLKLRQVALTFEVPERFVTFGNSASITLAGRNLLTWTDYAGDPELSDVADALGSTSSAGNFGRRDYYQLPIPRTFLITMRLGF